MVITLHPNAKTITKYHPIINEANAKYIQQNGISVELEYMKEKSYLTFSKQLEKACIEHNIKDHYEDLSFIIVIKNEQIRERYDAYRSNYNDDLTTKEVANFLLAYKELKPDQHLQLGVKSINSSASVKDTQIAKWMCQQIYSAIESRSFPIDIFGDKILYDIFGEDLGNTNQLDIKRLKSASLLKPKSPKVRVKKLYVELCLHIQAYLINETQLTAPEDTLLTDAQANFLFDVLQAIGYESEEKIDSPKKDYMHAMFSNNKAFIAKYNRK